MAAGAAAPRSGGRPCPICSLLCNRVGRSGGDDLDAALLAVATGSLGMAVCGGLGSLALLRQFRRRASRLLHDASRTDHGGLSLAVAWRGARKSGRRPRMAVFIERSRRWHGARRFSAPAPSSVGGLRRRARGAGGLCAGLRRWSGRSLWRVELCDSSPGESLALVAFFLKTSLR